MSVLDPLAIGVSSRHVCKVAFVVFVVFLAMIGDIGDADIETVWKKVFQMSQGSISLCYVRLLKEKNLELKP